MGGQSPIERTGKRSKPWSGDSVLSKTGVESKRAVWQAG